MFIKNKNFPFIFALILTDCIVFILSFLVAFYFRFHILHPAIIYSFDKYFILSLFLIPVWILFTNFFIGYRLFYISKFDLFIKITKTAFCFIIFILALIFIIKNDFSRLLIFFMTINLIFFTLIFRYIFKRLSAYVIYKLNIRNNLLVIGKNVRKYKKIFNNYYINKVFYYPYEDNWVPGILPALLYNTFVSQHRQIHRLYRISPQNPNTLPVFSPLSPL